MRPFDPRLIRYARSTVWLFVAQAVVGVAQTLGIIGMSWFLARAIVGIFLQHISVDQVLPLIWCAAAWLALRVVATWFGDWFAQSAATKIIWQLRSRSLSSLSPLQFAEEKLERSHVVTALGHGLQALEPYFRNFVPQLVLTCIATPVLLLVIFISDPTSFIFFVVLLPLIPVFMILIGWYTQSTQDRQWKTLQHLSSHFSDVVSGLTTLRIFRRAYHQREVLAKVSDQYRKATMRVLRVSFLSGFVLELAATLAVALVAVTIGVRLIGGDMSLQTGLFVLLLAPEVFLPLRNVGGAYHTATEGVQAANDVFEIIELAPATQPAELKSIDVSGGLRVRDLAVSHGAQQLVSGISFDAPRGQISVIRGASGSGKTSTVDALMGFVRAQGTLNDRPLGGGIASSTAWLPQGAPLISGTVAENIEFDTALPAHLVAEASELASVDLPAQALIDNAGGGVSGGQQQRIALARTFARALWKETPLLLLDEPTTGLDQAAIAHIAASLRTMAGRGFTVLVVSHEPMIWDVADHTIELGAVRA